MCSSRPLPVALACSVRTPPTGRRSLEAVAAKLTIVNQISGLQYRAGSWPRSHRGSRSASASRVWSSTAHRGRAGRTPRCSPGSRPDPRVHAAARARSPAPPSTMTGCSLLSSVGRVCEKCSARKSLNSMAPRRRSSPTTRRTASFSIDDRSRFESAYLPSCLAILSSSRCSSSSSTCCLVGKWKKKVPWATPAAATIALTSASAIPDRLNSAMAAPISRSRVCSRLASRAEGLSTTAMLRR